MSYGKKSHLFRPIDASMLPSVEGAFPSAKGHVRPIFDILTNSCVIESLLFVTVIDMINRYLSGDRSRYGIASGTLLSIIAKDKKGKMQTAEMELVHDVLVELQMAGMNFRRLQMYLKSHNMEILFMHSCGGDVSDPGSVDMYFQKTADEQLLRTTLDWSGEMLKNVSPAYARAHGIDAAGTLATIDRIISTTERIISAHYSGVTYLPLRA